MRDACATALAKPARFPQTFFWVTAYILAGFIGLAALVLNPAGSNRLLLVLDSNLQADTAWPLLDTLDARLVAVVSPRVILVESQSPIPPSEARKSGALFTFDGSAFAGCTP